MSPTPKVRPNHLTASRLVCAIIAIPFQQYGTDSALAVCMILLIAGEMIDVMDGWYARKYHMVSNLGKLFDPLCDCVSHLAVYAVFLQCGWMPLWMFLVMLSRELAVAYIRSHLSMMGILLDAQPSGKRKAIWQGISQPVVVFLHIVVDYDPITWLSVSRLDWWMLFSATVVTLHSFYVYAKTWNEMTNVMHRPVSRLARASPPGTG